MCRRARYTRLDALATDVVALAHHRDDQAETVLVNLLRGTGAGGLEGMAWKRGRYVRPLLGVSRADLGAWAAHRGLLWRDDPTNLSDRFLRNRIRREVLPLLEDVREGAVEALARSATLAADQGALLDALIDADPQGRPGPDGLSADWLARAHPALARRAVHRAWAPISTAQADAVIAAAVHGEGRIEAGGRILVVQQGRVRVFDG